MAPRANVSKISYMVDDSGSEDEIQRDDWGDNLPTPDSAVENRAPSRSLRANSSRVNNTMAKRGTKAKTAARRESGASVAPKNPAGARKAQPKRRALQERDYNVDEGTEEVDEFDNEEEEVEEEPVAKPARRGRPPKAKANVAVEVQVPKGQKKAAPKGRVGGKTKPTKREPSPEISVMEIAETQEQPEADPMDIEDSIEQSIEVPEIPETMPPPPPPSATRRNVATIATSRLKPNPMPQRRAGSVSDTERGLGDPALRRKLGEMTKKFEALQAKYDSLKEVATSQKESNFEKLQRKTDQVSKDQDAVIRSLKQEISDLRVRTAEIPKLKKTFAKLEEENSALVTEKKSLSSSLHSAQTENKTLSTKLAAARSSAQPETKTVPGSAVKSRPVVLPGSAEAAKEAQLRQLKEDLYSDLTGLIIRGVKKSEDGEDIYDCIQTGRNGTLHFHLSIATAEDGTPYDEIEFVYTPLLDENRDRDLIEILPDYLAEEIAFPRSHAAKFFTKVVDCMTKKVIVEE